MSLENQLQQKTEADTSRKPRTLFTRQQLDVLKKYFAKREYISREERKKLSVELGVSADKIKVWFQNNRMRKRRKEKEFERSDKKNAQYMPQLQKKLPENYHSANYQLNTGMNDSYYNGTYGNTSIPYQQFNIPYPGSWSLPSRLQTVKSSLPRRRILQNRENCNDWNYALQVCQSPFENSNPAYNPHNKHMPSHFFGANPHPSLHSSVYPSYPSVPWPNHVPTAPNFYSHNFASSSNENCPPVANFRTHKTSPASSDDSGYSRSFEATGDLNISLEHKPFISNVPLEDLNQTSNYGHPINNGIHPINQCNSATSSHFENGNTIPLQQSLMPQYHSLNGNTYSPYELMKSGDSGNDSMNSGTIQYESMKLENSWHDPMNDTKQLPSVVKVEQKPHFGNIGSSYTEHFIDYQNAHCFNEQSYSQNQDFQSQMMHQHPNFTNPEVSYSTVPQYSPISSTSHDLSPVSQSSKIYPNSQPFQQNETGFSSESFIQSDNPTFNGCHTQNNVELQDPQLCQENNTEFAYSQLQQYEPEPFHSQQLQNNL